MGFNSRTFDPNSERVSRVSTLSSEDVLELHPRPSRRSWGGTTGVRPSSPHRSPHSSRAWSRAGADGGATRSFSGPRQSSRELHPHPHHDGDGRDRPHRQDHRGARVLLPYGREGGEGERSHEEERTRDSRGGEGGGGARAADRVGGEKEEEEELRLDLVSREAGERSGSKGSPSATQSAASPEVRARWLSLPVLPPLGQYSTRGIRHAVFNTRNLTPPPCPAAANVWMRLDSKMQSATAGLRAKPSDKQRHP